MVALRSALVQKREATLFAGCGIVADSDPQAEYKESCLKLEVMQRSLSKNNTLMEIHDVSPVVKNPVNATYAYVQAFVDELQRANVHNVVICPGSRSTPLAIAFASVTTIHSWMHVDERSAAFFALGIAKKLQQPVALICTSGTAAANFLPAIVEARLSHIPLLVITADRPPELRDCGAPQAIDQNRLYGSFVKWFSELALPEATDAMLRYVRTIAQRAVGMAQAVPAGPVHLNMPFREPLVPQPSTEHAFPAPEARNAQAWQGRANNQPYVAISDPLPGLPSPARILQLLQMMCQARRGLIIVGPQNQSTLIGPLLALAQRLNFPILADPLSQLRGSKNEWILSSYDAFLRFPQVVHATEPDFILRIGAMPVSKPVLLYLQHYAACPQIVIDGQMGWEEPTQLVSELIHTDPTAFCQQLQSCLESLNVNQTSSETAWPTLWQRLDQCTQKTLETAIADFTEPFEGRVFTELSSLLPEATTLFVGNSMPIRDMDTFFWCRDRDIHILANRGPMALMAWSPVLWAQVQ
ncbi:hypothetical protein KDW_43240 [Dictyobacter vulcani]|uniref:2-succinyl-5-enolpyruvyl-6-hydroxy-3-cyclohexene-1-carboxylic-acid synthase n=2 Tax=Dictyobacter vulcani TaxID=2607529 RepID=A0A5J4KSP7_9CHLR|nr:hypothetical protein KDW_43240 [Dictyobacter vulcani]